MKLLVLFLLFIALGAGAESVRPPRAFTVKGKTGTVQTYAVSGAPGGYFIRVNCSGPETGPQHNAKITIGKGLPMIRRIIPPAVRQGRCTVDRVRLGRDPVKIRCLAAVWQKPALRAFRVTI